MAFTLGVASLNAWALGRADTARERIRQAIAGAGENNSLYEQTWAQTLPRSFNFTSESQKKRRHLQSKWSRGAMSADFPNLPVRAGLFWDGRAPTSATPARALR